jgi:hypothetical protein
VAGKFFEDPGWADRLGPEFVSVATPDEARAMVRTYRSQGADFIKVYHHLSRDVYFAIADEAKRQGMPFVGHVPEALDYGESSDAGQRSTEHLWHTPLECFASSVSELRSPGFSPGLWMPRNAPSGKGSERGPTRPTRPSEESPQFGEDGAWHLTVERLHSVKPSLRRSGGEEQLAAVCDEYSERGFRAWKPILGVSIRASFKQAEC